VANNKHILAANITIQNTPVTAGYTRWITIQNTSVTAGYTRWITTYRAVKFFETAANDVARPVVTAVNDA
jgi:hypothetical protein